MAEMRATPQNSLLAGLATALANTRSFLNPAPGTPLSNVSWFRPGDLLIGKAPEEVTEWSYGNAPFQVPPMSRVPQAKKLTTEAPDGTKETVSRALSSMDALLAAPTEMAARGAALGAPLMMGAVRKGGLPELVATHATRISDPKDVERVMEKGLYAPSIGLHGPGRNDYSPSSPQIVWNAGALDQTFEGMPPQIFNRDAYVWNPSPLSSYSIEDQFKQAGLSSLEKALSDLMGDSRLTQMLPDRWSQTAAILASPRFKSLSEWEASPFGAGALKQNSTEVDDYKYGFNMIAGRHGVSEGSSKAIDLLQTIGKLSNANVDMGLVEGSAAGDLYSLARRAPSMMGEMKIYSPNVMANPFNSVVYTPGTANGIEGAEAFGEAGFRVYGDEHLRALEYLDNGRFAQGAYSKRDAPLWRLAPPSGKLPPPPDELMEIYLEQSGKPTRTQVAMPANLDEGFDELFSMPDPATDPAAIAAHQPDALDKFLAAPPKTMKEKATYTTPFTKAMVPEPTSLSYAGLIHETENTYKLPYETAKKVVDTWMDTGAMGFYQALNKVLGLDELPAGMGPKEAVTMGQISDMMGKYDNSIALTLEKGFNIPKQFVDQIMAQWLDPNTEPGTALLDDIVNKFFAFKPAAPKIPTKAAAEATQKQIFLQPVTYDDIKMLMDDPNMGTQEMFEKKLGFSTEEAAQMYNEWVGEGQMLLDVINKHLGFE